MANEYITSSELKATLTLTSETYADADIAVAIEAASRALDKACGRRFWLDDVAATRYYERENNRLVVIDDLVTLTSVKTDPDGTGTYSGTWTENTDFVFHPFNASADSAPYTMIERLPAASNVLPSGPRRIQVIGIFGWADIPPQIIEATSVMSTRFLKRMREAPFGIAGMGYDGGAVLVPKVDPDMMTLISGLVRSPPGSHGMGLV